MNISIVGLSAEKMESENVAKYKRITTDTKEGIFTNIVDTHSAKKCLTEIALSMTVYPEGNNSVIPELADSDLMN